MNKLMPFQVKRLFELAEEGVSSRKLLESTPDMEETIGRGSYLWGIYWVGDYEAFFFQ